MADTEKTEKEQIAVNNGTSISQIAKKIDECDNILVTLSKNPSVDEMTAALGLTIFLDKLGKHATAIYSGRAPNMIQFLKPDDTFESNTNSLQDFIVALNKDKADHLRYSIDGDYVKIYITPYKTTIEEKDLEFSHGDYNVDLVIALNVPTVNDLDAALTEHGRIMHDASAIDITTGQPGKFGEIEWSDPKASSVSEMTADLVLSIQNTKNPMNQASATAFLTGIIANTKRFSNEKTTPKTMNVSSELMKLGADQQLVSSHLEEDNTPVSTVSEDEVDPTQLTVEHPQEHEAMQPSNPIPEEVAAPPIPPSPESNPEAGKHGQPDLTPSPEMEARAQTPPEPEFVALSQPPTPAPTPVPEPASVPTPAPTPPVSPSPESNPEAGKHGQPDLTPSPEMEARAQTPPEPEFVALSQPPAPTPAPEPAPAPTPAPTPPVSPAPESNPTIEHTSMPTTPEVPPQPTSTPTETPISDMVSLAAPEPEATSDSTPVEPPLSGAVELPPPPNAATTGGATANEIGTPPTSETNDASLIAPDKKPLNVPAPEEKDYGKMIDEALAETTLQGDAPIEPTQPIVTNMAVAAAPPVMEQPEANSVPNINYSQAPDTPEQSAPQPVPIPTMETLPPPPPPPIASIPDDQSQSMPQPVSTPTPVAPQMQPQPVVQVPQPTVSNAQQPTPVVVPQPQPATTPEVPVQQPQPVSTPTPVAPQMQPQPVVQVPQPTVPNAQQPTPETMPPAEEMPAPTLTPDMFQIPDA